MAPTPADPGAVDEYIAAFEPEIRDRLELVRSTLHAAVPGLTDGIRYQIPYVGLDGTYLVHYAGWKHHIGLYPVPVFGGEQADLEAELGPRRASKDTVKLLHRDPIPVDLLGRLARALVAERSEAS